MVNADWDEPKKEPLTVSSCTRWLCRSWSWRGRCSLRPSPPATRGTNSSVKNKQTMSNHFLTTTPAAARLLLLPRWHAAELMLVSRVGREGGLTATKHTVTLPPQRQLGRGTAVGERTVHLCCAMWFKIKKDEHCILFGGLLNVTNESLHRVSYIYIYIHVYAYTHIYIYTYMHIYTYTYIHTCIYIHTYIYIYIHTYIDKYIYIYTYTHIHIYIYTHIYTYIDKDIYIYIHTYIYIYTHIYMCVYMYVCVYMYFYIYIHIYIHYIHTHTR